MIFNKYRPKNHGFSVQVIFPEPGSGTSHVKLSQIREQFRYRRMLRGGGAIAGLDLVTALRALASGLSQIVVPPETTYRLKKPLKITRKTGRDTTSIEDCNPTKNHFWDEKNHGKPRQSVFFADDFQAANVGFL